MEKVMQETTATEAHVIFNLGWGICDVMYINDLIIDPAL